MTTLTLSAPTAVDSRLVRVAGTLPVAALMVAALFYAMHLMVFSDVVAPPVEEAAPTIEIFMKEIDIITNLKEPLERPVEPSETPEAPEIEPVITQRENNHTAEIFAPIEFGDEMATLVLGDNQLTPFIRVSPRYPRRALERGVEGFVDVSFDITSFGGTDNIHVINAEPQGTFDKAALKAVRKWKYKPQIVDGEPQPALNLRERIRFRLEK